MSDRKELQNKVNEKLQYSITRIKCILVKAKEVFFLYR